MCTESAHGRNAPPVPPAYRHVPACPALCPSAGSGPRLVRCALPQIAESPADPFWQHAKYVMAQYDGLKDGYQKAVHDGHSHTPPLTDFDFQTLNANGDLFQIIPAVLRSRRPQWSSMSLDDKTRTLEAMGHCSAIVKVTGNFSALLMGHSSWYTYSATNRIFKHYDLAFRNDRTAAHRMSFSSYPGGVTHVHAWVACWGTYP